MSAAASPAEITAALEARAFRVKHQDNGRWIVSLGALSVDLDAAGLAQFADRAAPQKRAEVRQ